eukprot:GAHX01003317.1.p1 GENE.GAHX01003317.1~~GAHX01003317.1.p1  ORF type:complete len:65 (+),score=9.65 GAHX01003317.1:58-252(+)
MALIHFTFDDSGNREYTLKKMIGSEFTLNSHPARFSPVDKYSAERLQFKMSKFKNKRTKRQLNK